MVSSLRKTILEAHMQEAAFLSRVPLFANLPETDLVTIGSIMHPRSFRRDELIFHKGDLGQVMYVVKTGRVRIFMVTEDMQEVSVALLTPGDFFGELAILDEKPRSASAIAMERTETLALHRDDFVTLIRDRPEMATTIMAVLSARLRQANELIENLIFLDVYGRVAKKLLDLAESHGAHTEEGIVINLRLTQRDIASMVGSTRESVNRVLGLYQDKGIISIRNQLITILKPAELRKRIY